VESSEAGRDEPRETAGDLELEDVHPLSPVQEGMLFHTLSEPESGVYVQQFTCLLEGDLEVSAFQEAWRRLIARHAAVRTSVRWSEDDRPVQAVYRRVELDLERRDWSGDSPEVQDEALEDYLRADRERGFIPTLPPLHRLALFRLGERSHRLVWSNHH